MQISYYFLVQPKDKRKIIRLGQSQSDRFQEQHTAATAVASVGILEKKKRKEKKWRNRGEKGRAYLLPSLFPVKYLIYRSLFK